MHLKVKIADIFSVGNSAINNASYASVILSGVCFSVVMRIISILCKLLAAALDQQYFLSIVTKSTFRPNGAIALLALRHL